MNNDKNPSEEINTNDKTDQSEVDQNTSTDNNDSKSVIITNDTNEGNGLNEKMVALSALLLIDCMI